MVGEICMPNYLNVWTTGTGQDVDKVGETSTSIGRRADLAQLIVKPEYDPKVFITSITSLREVSVSPRKTYHLHKGLFFHRALHNQNQHS